MHRSIMAENYITPRGFSYAENHFYLASNYLRKSRKIPQKLRKKNLRKISEEKNPGKIATGLTDRLTSVVCGSNLTPSHQYHSCSIPV